MKKYMVFGFTNLETFDESTEPTQEERQEIMNRWKAWMLKIGDLLLDMGSPLINGKAINKNGVLDRNLSSLAGYMKIQAEDLEHAMSLLNESPLFKNGHAQNYEIFECVM